MAVNNDEMEYKQVSALLKNLSKVEAPKDFETTLWRKINAANYEPRIKEEKWYEKFLIPSRLIPSSALALTLVILVAIFNIPTQDSENPLMVQPKMISSVSGTLEQSTPPPAPEITVNKTEVTQAGLGYATASLNASVNKNGYNFLQVRLNDQEKEKVNRLKERIRSYFNRDKQ